MNDTLDDKPELEGWPLIRSMAWDVGTAFVSYTVSAMILTVCCFFWIWVGRWIIELARR